MKQRETAALRAQKVTCGKGWRQPEPAGSTGVDEDTWVSLGLSRTNRQVLLSGENKVHQVSGE